MASTKEEQTTEEAFEEAVWVYEMLKVKERSPARFVGSQIKLSES